MNKRKFQVLCEKNENVIRPKRVRTCPNDLMKNDENIDKENINVLNELTPPLSSTISKFEKSQNCTPLPNLTYGDASKVWNSMLKCDNYYQRDKNMFTYHPSIQPSMRATVLDWLNEVCQAYNLTRQTYYLATDFFDRYLSKEESLDKKQLQLIGITCLFIAAKIEEIFPPKLERFAFVCDGACNSYQIIGKELIILDKLNWELHPTTPVAWLNIYLRLYNLLEQNEEKKCMNESFLIPDYDSELFAQIVHLIDLCILDAGSLAFSYSVITASAFFHFTNEEIVLKCTGKLMMEIQTCVEWMVPFAMALKNTGFDFIKKFELEHEKVMIQTHTTNLNLLQTAHEYQLNVESEKISELEFSENSYVTPPPSSDF